MKGGCARKTETQNGRAGFFYVTKKNSRTKTDKLSFKKYDPIARKHVEFKETRPNLQDQELLDLGLLELDVLTRDRVVLLERQLVGPSCRSRSTTRSRVSTSSSRRPRSSNS
jgi:ribosomal protein L33